MSGRGSKRARAESKSGGGWVQAFTLFALIFNQVAERFGVTAAIFCLLLGAVRLFGDAKTQNDFMREVLFADVTHTRYVQVFFGALVALMACGALLRKKSITDESKEMKRLAAEKGALQQKLIGSTLSHTDGGEV